MGKVTPAVTDTFVDPSHGFPSPSPGRGTFLFSGQEPLDPLQVLLVFPEEPGVSNLRIITHSGEGIQGQVQPDGYILQDLAVDTAQAGTFRLEFGERLLLTIQAQGFFSLLIGCLALFKEVIIQPTALLKSLLHESLLGLGGSEPVLEGLTHVSSIAQSWEVGLRG